MWALGVVLYTMLYGQFPFYDNVPQELFNKIKVTLRTQPTIIGNHFFDELCSFLQRLLGKRYVRFMIKFIKLR